jgi:hypothetical protein
MYVRRNVKLSVDYPRIDSEATFCFQRHRQSAVKLVSDGDRNYHLQNQLTFEERLLRMAEDWRGSVA